MSFKDELKRWQETVLSGNGHMAEAITAESNFSFELGEIDPFLTPFLGSSWTQK